MRIFCVLLLTFAAAACGGDDAPVGDTGTDTGTMTDSGADSRPPDPDTGPVDSGMPDTGPSDTGPDDTGPACVPDMVCATNPGAPCFDGVTDCATGVEVCVDAMPAADGTVCPTGTCVAGECLGATDVTADLNLTTDSTTGGACGDGAQHEVSVLPDAMSATLSADPAAGCLDPGDEVLLINLQGAAGAVDNVGNWELLTVDTVSGSTATFTTAKTRFYGSATDSDADIGAGPSQQRVALIRVPHYGALSIGAGATLTAAAFDGQTGGVIALRTNSLAVDGAISATGIGYRSGRWSRDGGCDDSVTTESGGSISGPPVQSTMRNQGGPGGLGAGLSSSFNTNTPISASAGHALPGEPGLNAIRPLGEPGAAYGVDDGTRLTMGSGASGGLTCRVGGFPPLLVSDGAGTTAGGIILLFVGDLSVSATGSITASAEDLSRDVSSSGGYVSIVGGDLAIGTDLVSARGGIGMGVGGPTLGMSNASSPGYIVLEATGALTGTSVPAANEL